MKTWDENEPYVPAEIQNLYTGLSALLLIWFGIFYLTNFSQNHFRLAICIQKNWQLWKKSQNVAKNKSWIHYSNSNWIDFDKSNHALVRISKVRHFFWQNNCHLIRYVVILLTKSCRVYTNCSQIPDLIFSTVRGCIN